MRILVNWRRFVELLLLLVSGNLSAQQSWQPVGGNLMTRWAKTVSPDNVLPEYPRPMMVREHWLNLNGLWEYAIAPHLVAPPARFEGKILVPFAIESALSGVGKAVGPQNRLWYRRTVPLPAEWRDQRILLHFGAVDWETVAWVNGVEVGQHRGGYDPFTFDITHALNSGGEQEIVVAVWDPTDKGHQPNGKQVLEPHGFWYTAVTGIWQTVWLEPVEKTGGYIRHIETTPDIDNETVTLKTRFGGDARGRKISVIALEEGKKVAETSGAAGEILTLKIPEAKRWSPESPFLYDLEITLWDGSQVVDRVKSYVGMRKISLIRDEQGVLRIALNNQICFQYGLLDQGWWPDGLYTAPTDEALRYDMEVARKLGFNLVRKHIKVEPQRFYYWADRMGVLLWQDMVSGDVTGEWGTARNANSARQFEVELARMIDALSNHPSILIWVIFNEGWGQYDTERLTAWLKARDPSRLVIGASGFVDYGTGDIRDVHAYPGPTGAPFEENRALVLSEFGGLGLPVEGHIWREKKATMSYQGYKNAAELTVAYEQIIQKTHPYISNGLSAIIYTQISDVEREINGIMTYEREMIKMDVPRLQETARRLYAVAPGSWKFQPIVPTSQKTPQQWRITLQKPPEGWQNPGFDDAGWTIGEGGFGNPKWVTPVIRTKWTEENIWLRKSFTLNSADFQNLYLIVYHDFELITHVYLNGEHIAEAPEHQFAYTLFPLNNQMKKLLRKGKNTLAVQATRTSRRQYVDVGVLVLKSW